MAAKKVDRSRHAIVSRAEKAMRELDLSLITQADKDRWWRIWRGLRALDDEQSEIKGRIEELLENYEKSQGILALTSGLKKIIGARRTCWELLSTGTT